MMKAAQTGYLSPVTDQTHNINKAHFTTREMEEPGVKN